MTVRLTRPTVEKTDNDHLVWQWMSWNAKPQNFQNPGCQALQKRKGTWMAHLTAGKIEHGQFVWTPHSRSTFSNQNVPVV